MEFTEQKLDYVVKILNDNAANNKLKIDRKMVNYFNNPAETNEAEDVAKRTFKLLYDATTSGVNIGYKENKKEIAKLSKILSQMSSPKASKKVDKSNKELDRIAKALKLEDKKKMNEPINAIKEEIKYAIKGIDHLCKINGYFADEANTRAMLKDISKKLEDMNQKLDTIVDTTSRTAIQSQYLLYVDLHELSDLIANRAISKDSFDLILKDANEKLDEWSNLYVFKDESFRNQAKKFADADVTNLYRVSWAIEKGLYRIDGIKNAFEVFCRNLRDKREINDLDNDIKEKEAKVAELKAANDKIKKAYKNGEKTKESAQAEVEANLNLIEDYEDMIQDLKLQKQESSSSLVDSEAIIIQFKNRMNIFDKFSKNPVELYFVIKERDVNFQYFEMLFGGAGFSSGKISEALEEFDKLERAYEKAAKNKDEVLRHLRQSSEAKHKRYLEYRERDRLEREEKRKAKVTQVHNSRAEAFLFGEEEEQIKTQLPNENIDDLITENAKATENQKIENRI